MNLKGFFAHKAGAVTDFVRDHPWQAACIGLGLLLLWSWLW